MTNSKYIVINQFGGPEVLQLAEKSIPDPKNDEVLIKNLYTGVSFGDIILRIGKAPFQKPPLIPGNEVVGIIQKTGNNVTSLKVGQLVAALTFFGGYSEYICLHQKELMPIPKGVKPEDAACLILNYLIAYQLLHRCAKIKKGEKVLVHGASGGIGTAILQLGKIIGAEMYGTASPEKHSYVSGLGAIPIDYKNSDFCLNIKKRCPDGIDIVFDSVGGTTFKKSYSLLRKNGRLIGYGSQNLISTLRTIIFRSLIPDSRRAYLYLLIINKRTRPRWIKEDLQSLFKLIIEGTLKPVINECFPLKDAKIAHKKLESGTVMGKILLKVDKGI
ncbi:MAG: medium chain dehydrogenase/reductase family protein [Clostridium sp.]|jgi:NADPH2:quinone reductase|uniref:medium chain dehydrogenase/reductase family protein n=1 Tax=Clostridium sp. TaxID=1506 RepID=UPI0025B7F154|nr:medium chain dehydrogenase/reductase family protein [Clostridium sp.]MCH3963586.1 medium chain dehydrogenase/reductase family protein [Clostridium sp.]MCI1714727.1 medium chain dehydrogenase/reductase family protein [Clostridium sp.]MCI1799084.1 medium chain dehydrogenase/reductase family protein [Clostridium sp.]MCI1812910.1 medium chain dehydrogenase/reductase family protein [Clostridium sp.]MCI1869800.1 medium chain dehydrogenase/reductase family protein [Clostridium sp.]